MLVTGVGGQGIVLASDTMGEAALAAGYDIKKTDTLGMAQRGGSVVSHVRIGHRVWSPLIKEGEVHAEGSPAEVVTEQNIKQVYGAENCIYTHLRNGLPVILLTANQDATTGKAGVEWK